MSTWPHGVVCRTSDSEIRILREEDCSALSAMQPGDLTCAQGNWVFNRGNPLPWVQVGLQALANEEGFHCGIWQGTTLVGVICLISVQKRNRVADISYAMDARFRRQGIMTRACRALVDCAFNELGLNRIQVDPDVDNRPSRAVLERLGFVLEGIIRDRYYNFTDFRDCALYSMLARDWRRRGGEHPPAN